MSADGMVEPEKHEADHRWIDDEREEQKRCRDNRHKMLNLVIGGSALGFVGTLGAGVLKAIKHFFPNLFI